MDTLRRFLILVAIVLSTLAVSSDGAAKKKEVRIEKVIFDTFVLTCSSLLLRRLIL